MKKPKALKKGDAIGIVAPAGKMDPSALEKGLERIRKLGFEVVMGKHLADSFRYFSATDRQRAEDLQWMFAQDVRAILCARGGYGSVRLIPHLEMKQLKGSDKIFIGCSDLTTLLLHLSNFEIPVFHGPMVSHFSRTQNPLSDHFFLRMLTSRDPIGKFFHPTMKSLKEGTGEGALTGGCLSLLCSSIGTPYEIDTEGKILFIEEVNEPPYRIDRMLTHLKMAGKFQKVKGILFGTLLNCDPPPDSGYTLKEVVLSCLEDVACPALWGVPFGHGNENITLPIGLKVHLNGNERTITFLESPVG
ncbi:MAG: LD-carboxypeptidase [Nitrospirae bacterium]|nr:LD-carboxypeptidase [Nitrospirota bacterium]